ncbi:MAG: N-acetylmuramoyl-L-alanine amidase [Chroococcales cyanobacterium]
MKFAIDMGHNCPPDIGATGIEQEDTLTKAVGQRVINKLEALGYSTVNCTPTWASSVGDSLRKRVYTANVKDVDVYVSIHFNAFNGNANGTEVFAVSDSGRKMAQPVLENLVALGFYNRGVKNGSHLYVLKNTHMPAILVECCFIDSRKDMGMYNTEKVANAIVKGLVGELPEEKSEPNQQVGSRPTQDPEVLKLQKSLNRLQIRDDDGRALVEDGLWGAKTSSASKRFHNIMAISASGKGTIATWKAFEEIISQPILRPNHATGKATRYVQFRVGSGIDGIYGPNTAQAVIRYQRQQGLIADGIIGPQSWGKLLS